MSNLPAELRRQLAEEFAFDNLEPVRVLGSDDTTRKFLFRLGDGALIECVLIPASPALYGEALRSPDALRLDAGRLRLWLQVLRERPRRLEPQSRRRRDRRASPARGGAERRAGQQHRLHGHGRAAGEFRERDASHRIINAPWGVGIGARHITISTSGLAPQIRQLADQPLQSPPRHFPARRHRRSARADHAGESQVPSRTARTPATTTRAKKQRITFEYILIEGVNDAPTGRALAGHARRSTKVNLIPYNTVEGLAGSAHARTRRIAFAQSCARTASS